MSLACVLLLAGSLPGSSPLPNLDFASGRLTEWTGEGFYITSGTGRGPSLRSGVCSSDRGVRGKTALLHRTFIVPPGVGALCFSAATVRPTGMSAGPPLDITLETAGGRFLPRQVRTVGGWQSAPQLLPLSKGRPHDYRWLVEDLIGRPVRIVLHDADARPGCYLFCSGFRIESADASNRRKFTSFMRGLEQKHQLAPMSHLESKHFVAISNTADEFTQERLYDCETIYTVFAPHFRKKGFQLRDPGAKLMVAIFDSQAGFEAYLGRHVASTTTGIYHPMTNRLVVYDFAGNRSFTAARRKAAKAAGRLHSSLDQQRAGASISRQSQTFRADANLGTIMHEVAHQLSFNNGLLNRDADVPAWLAEGLACYCEATVNGSWQGLGEPNPLRSQTLAEAVRKQRPFLRLQTLLRSDDWLRRAPDTEQVLLGYAQSWALFRMLMEQHPQALRKYLACLYNRRTPEHRLADWTQSFGTDLPVFDRGYQDYLRALVHQEARPAR